MSIPQPPQPAKLVVSILLEDRSLIEKAAAFLTGSFGEGDYISAWLPFDYTDYYTDEMGAPLYRRMISFHRLVDQGRLADIKHATNRIEAEFVENGRRRVNLDPGYLLYERFVLATGKNHAHRIYVGNGIYADLTLVYQKGAYRPLRWTYPDYADTPLLTCLEVIRRKYALDLAER